MQERLTHQNHIDALLAPSALVLYKITRKSDAPAVIHSHTHKICHIILLFCHIGIQDRIIALSATPEHIALTTKFYGDFNGFLICAAA